MHTHVHTSYLVTDVYLCPSPLPPHPPPCISSSLRQASVAHGLRDIVMPRAQRDPWFWCSMASSPAPSMAYPIAPLPWICQRHPWRTQVAPSPWIRHRHPWPTKASSCQEPHMPLRRHRRLRLLLDPPWLHGAKKQTRRLLEHRR